MSVLLQLRLLGRFQLLRQGSVVTDIAAPRAVALLSYLALHHGTPLPRQQTAFLFWPDSNEVQAQANLRKQLHQLMHALPELRQFVDDGRQTLLWRDDGDFDLDVLGFDRAVQSAEHAAGRGDMAALRRALLDAVQLYGGDLVPGCYDDWILPERERLHNSYSAALEQLLTLLENSREYDLAIGLGRRLLQHDPLRESSYRRLMSLYALAGERANLKRTYDSCGALLRRELNVEPSPATHQLYLELTAAAQEEGPVRVAPAGGDAQQLPSNNLAAPPTPFVGREAQLAAIARLLRQPDVRLLTLSGPPGIGKSRLATHAAALLADFKDGVFCVPLDGIADPARLTAQIAATLGLARPDAAEVELAELQRFLRDKRMLLILDSFEHLLPAAPLVADLLGRCPYLKIMVTSRVLLRLQGEHELRVPPLSTPPDRQTITVRDLERYEATRLFVMRAAVARQGFAATDSNAAAIAAITRRVDALPLAIEWAAARVRFLPPEVLVGRLENRLSLLAHGALDLPARQQSLRSAVAWSYELLSEPEQRLFRCVAVFDAPFDVPSAAAICQPGVAPDLMLDTLTLLVEKSLLMLADPANGHAHELRFTMLQTIRDYALERLLESDEASRLGQRYANYLAQQGGGGRAAPSGASPPPEARRPTQDTNSYFSVLGHHAGQWRDRLLPALSVLAGLSLLTAIAA